jgi:hypothetical protein
MGNVFVNRRSTRRALIGALLVLSSLVLLVLLVELSALSDVVADLRAADAIEPPSPPPIEMAEPAREPRLPERPVFRHSVISGGAYTADEVEAAMSRDSIVAAHYSAVNARALRVETLPEDRAVYMSYRIGDDIFWTKHKVRLKQGETILTDGVSHIRARCGNCIAFAPMEPTADDEPGEMEFDALIDDSDVLQSRMPLGSELLSQPLAGIPLLWLLGSSSDPFAVGNAMGGGSIGIPLYGYIADRAELELADATPQLPFFPSLDEEPPYDAFPGAVGPFTNRGPDDTYDPGDPGKPGEPSVPEGPGDPGHPHYPIFPPLEEPVVAPEPATILLVGGGVAAWLARRRRVGGQKA